MDQFLEVVKLGATSPNNDIRVENEKKLVDYRESDPLGFLNNCMASFGTDTTDAGIRQIIGTIFKIKGEGVWWYTIAKNLREEVKNVCLGNLISPIEGIRSVTADVVCSQSAHFNDLRTGPSEQGMAGLGFICEKLAANKLKPDADDTEKILAGVACGLIEEQGNNDLRVTSLKAVQDMIPFFKDQLREETTRDFFLTLILKHAKMENEEVVLKAIQCLIDIFRNCYEYLSERYMNVILDITTSLMRNSVESIVIATTEFWDSVAKFEGELVFRTGGSPNVTCLNFVFNYSNQLTQVLLENLLKKDNEELESGLSIHSVTMDCLSKVNSLGFKTNKDLNISFISNQIVSERDLNKVAALQCFEAMIIGAPEDISKLIESSFTTILQLLLVNEKLCIASLKVISAVAINYTPILLHEQICPKWLELTAKLLQNDLKYAPDICKIYAECGNSLYGSSPGSNSYFMTKSLDLCQGLLEICFTKLSQSELYIASDIFIARMSIAKSLDTLERLGEFMDFSSKCLFNVQRLPGELKSAVKEGLFIDLMVGFVYSDRLADHEEGWGHPRQTQPRDSRRNIRVRTQRMHQRVKRFLFRIARSRFDRTTYCFVIQLSAKSFRPIRFSNCVHWHPTR